MASVYQGSLLFCPPCCFAYALNVIASGWSKGRWCLSMVSGGWSCSPLLKCNFNNALAQLNAFPCPFVKQRKTSCRLTCWWQEKSVSQKCHLFKWHLYLKYKIRNFWKTVFWDSLGGRDGVAACFTCFSGKALTPATVSHFLRVECRDGLWLGRELR